MAPSPLFTIVTPVYNTPSAALVAMVESVTSQTLGDWELILVDDKSTDSSIVPQLRDFAVNDPRVRVIESEVNQGIVGASNNGIAAAQGEFVALLDHDDLLVDVALERVAEVIASDPEVDYIYTDEDKVDESGRFYDAFAKPEWSPERLRGHMYTGHLSVFRTALVRSVGSFREGYDGSQDHDLTLRVTEVARRVRHLPEVLYHWNAIPGSAAADANAKPYAWDAGVKAVDDHLKRVGINGRAVRGRAPSHYTVERAFELDEKVSVVIPTRGSAGRVFGEDRVFVVEAVRSILAHTALEDLEIVVVADDETPPSVVDALHDIAGSKLKLTAYSEPFNFSRKCNAGFLDSRGSSVIFLNDDIQVTSKNALESLVAPLREVTVGATGARLSFEDGTLQHGGHRYANGDFTHAYLNASPDYPGEFSSLFVNREASGLTGACLAVRRDVFEEVGGFTESLPLNYNDVDFSLKIRSRGYNLVWMHDVEMYHFESKTRVNRIEPYERAFLTRRWGTPSRDPFLP